MAIFEKFKAALAAIGVAGALIAAAQSASAQPSGELRVASPFSLTVMDLDGAQSADRLVLTINRQLYDGLTFLNDETGELEPGLATSWEATDSGWTFKLRDGVTFHDGETFTAEDVKATVEKVLDTAGPISPILSGVQSIDAVDDLTVELTTETPLGALPNNLALLGIAPAHLLGNEDFQASPVGTGPFKFESFSPGQQLVLTANEDYWRGPSGVATLVFVDIPETTTRVTALETGEIDITWGFPAISYAKLERNDDLTVETVKAFLNYELLFNWNVPPLDDPKVREALALAINDKVIFEGLLGPLSAPSTSALPPTVFGSADVGSWGYDPERARQLLEEAGYGPGDITLTLLGRNQKDENDVGLAMISDWAKIGVQVTPRYMELSSWAQAYVAQDFELSIVRRPTNTGDADWTLGRMYLTSSDRIPCANEELDSYILEGQGSTEAGVRQAAYKKALQYLHDNLCGYWPRDVLEAYAWSNRVKGFTPSPATLPTFHSVTVDE